MTALRNVRILDPSAASLGDPVDVLFDDRITAIRPASDAALGPEEIDGAGRTLIPGLIDTHVHLGELQAMIDAARAGITTVVDLGTTPDSKIHEQKDADGTPSILSAGAAACAPGGSQIVRMGFPESGGVEGPEDAERYLQMRVEAGSDLIKIIIEDPEATDVPALDIPTITALVDGAHERGAARRGPRGDGGGLRAGPRRRRRHPDPRPARRHPARGHDLPHGRPGCRELSDAGDDAHHRPALHSGHGAGGGGACSGQRAADAQGLRADLVLVDGDPLTDPSALPHPDAVWIEGVPAR